MFDFDGNAVGGSRVNLGGGGRNRTRGEESRSDFVKRQHREREAREKKRIRDKAATQIQAVWRGHRCLRAAHALQRQVFDKRSGDIAKVGSKLPQDTKAKFVFHALVPMLRPFVFFFSRDEDAQRLTIMLDWILFSACQQPPCNILHLALASDDGQRQSFLVLFEKLFRAMTRSGRVDEVVRLLLSMQAALFNSHRPVDSQRSGPTIGHFLRRTDVLVVLARDVIPRVADAQAVGRALELTALCCAGLEACEPAPRQHGLATLLSAPHLGELLCEAPGNLPRECLRRLVEILPSTPEPSDAMLALLGQDVEGAPRWAWLLGNLIVVLERYLLVGGNCPGESLLLWLAWLCWVREHGPGCSPAQAANPRLVGQLERLTSAPFVHALVQAMDGQSSDGLLAACRLYFSGDCEPSVEVLQTLAFATPLAGKLFSTLTGLMRSPSIEAVFEALGPPRLATPEAVRLRVFCAVYALQMQPMYDTEFFGSANPLRTEEIELLTPFLNRLAYHFVTSMPEQATLSPTAKALRTSLTSLIGLLYNRHCRQKILHSDVGWIIPDSKLLIRRAPVVDLGSDDPVGDDAPEASPNDDDDRMDVDEAEAAAEQTRMPWSAAARAAAAAAPSSQAGPGAKRVLEAVLEEIPHVLPFEDRVMLLQNIILADQEQRRDTRGPWAQSAMHRHQIRRNALVEDGFAAFEGLNEEGQLRDVFRVEFIAPDGTPESGVDGGGLFKEFLVTICRSMFDPEFGMFSATSAQTLIPSVGAFKVHKKATELYTFLGKVIGKAIYEMFLLEAQFSRVFLNRLLGRTNEVDDVAALDKELHRNMLRIKESADVEELGLTFSVSISEFGKHEEIDLIPNGRNTPVTKENLTRYFHLMANYKTNVQFQRHTDAFLRGMQCVIPLTWLKMFYPYELNILISGSSSGFDVRDLRQHTVYSGGYQDDSPVITWLWQLLHNHMEPEDMGRFLMFATSCSRAPLLGFKTLYPKFCIHRVPDSERLPTASTCANLLKLPDYTSQEALKIKILQAIRAEAGFDLS